MTWHVRDDCRLCRGRDLTTVLQLAPTPPANEFVKTGDQEQEKIPLYLSKCGYCGHVQLPVVVDPERLFGNYVYVSGTSPSFVAHFRRYAESCARGLKPGDQVVDIGSNDGTLLRQFQALGMRVIGIDPAREIAKQATADGVPTIPAFFNAATARQIEIACGKASLVTANNVFAHADDLAEIALAAKSLLKEDGRFVFEVQYLVDLVDKTLFDMVYHEHLSYHSLAPLVPFFDRLGMTLVDAERVDTHGGSIRCTVSPVAKRPKSGRLIDLMIQEHFALFNDPFDKLAGRIAVAGSSLHKALSKGGKIAGFGAPAKLTTLMHQFGIGAEQIAYVVDDSPWKQGLLTPGTRIPVVPATRLTDDPPDRVVVFAWNFADQIAAKHQELHGRFIVPLPEYREI